MERFPSNFKWSSEAKNGWYLCTTMGEKLKPSHDGQSVALDKYLNISYLLYSTASSTM